eukprot:4353371-Ditylum_brightwellii.AAC.1
MGFYGEVMSYCYSSKTGISGFTVTKPDMSSPNDKNVDINTPGVELLPLIEDKDEGLFVKSIAKRVDNLKDLHLADWYKTYPEDDPTNLLKSPVQGLPAGGMNYPVNQGPDDTASLITLGSIIEILVLRRKIFGVAFDYDPSAGSYQVVPATLSYKF